MMPTIAPIATPTAAPMTSPDYDRGYAYGYAAVTTWLDAHPNAPWATPMELPSPFPPGARMSRKYRAGLIAGSFDALDPDKFDQTRH